MNWSEGYTASYYITLVDPISWRDIGRMEITGGSIDRSGAELMESADLDMTELPVEREPWVRIWLDADQNGVEHVPLFTGLASCPERSINGERETYNVECFSVLKPIDDILLDRGFYVPAEVTASDAAARLLRKGVAPVEIQQVDNPPKLEEAIIAEDGESCLTMAERVLNAINWQIIINGKGEITVRPKTAEEVAVFDVNANDVIELSVSDKYDWFSCPNVFRATSGDLTAIARDDDETSELSTVNRGREIWAEESSVNLGTNESLSAYAMRKLKEMQSPARTISYSRRYHPDVTVGDIVRINHPEIGIDGSFRVDSQSIDLSFNARTSETAIMETT